MILAYHDVRAPPKDYNRLFFKVVLLPFAHSHARRSVNVRVYGLCARVCAGAILTAGDCFPCLLVLLIMLFSKRNTAELLRSDMIFVFNL